jgi:RHS repeat-associated protein
MSREWKKKFPVLLSLILLLCSTLTWRASDDPIGPDEPPVIAETLPDNAGDTAEEPRVVAALPPVRRVDAVQPLDAGAFELVLEAPPEAISRAFLIYELAGVPHWTAAVRSINGFPSAGGFAAAGSSGTKLQIEEINPRWLHAGLNQVRFLPAPTGVPPPSRLTNLKRPYAIAAEGMPLQTLPYMVRNLRLVYHDGTAQPTPSLILSHPVNGENDAAGTVLRGFVSPSGLPAGPAELFVDAVYLPEGINQADGTFSVFVPRTAPEGEAWETEIEVVYPDGSRVRRTVKLAGDTGEDDGDSEDGAELDADPDSEKSLRLDDASLDITRGALGRKVRLTMRRLRGEELPALDSGMTNVTPQARGFRLGPHGLRFNKPVHLRLPYDAALIPAGMTVEDVRTYFFDEEAGRWFPLPRVNANGSGEVEAQGAADVIVSATDHFTDFINATLALPEESSGANYSPNSLQELAKPDPASGIVQIEPPQGGPAGDATLDFPLVIPPGRQGMQPELAVRYNSGGGNGWLGVGWDLRLPAIEISTSFGVPRYEGEEQYLFDGEQLVATSAAGVYVRRVEGRFDRIVRKGTAPGNYSWEVTDKDGRVSLYGRTAQARLSDPHAPGTGHIFRWYLEEERDLHGNKVEYFYFTDSGADGELWAEVYPQRIEYTAGPNLEAFYKVTFTLDARDTRPDRLSSGRQGFKTYTRRRLASAQVLAGASLVRQYRFAYRTGDFQKSLLQSIAVTGERGAAEFYHHTFDYVRMATEGEGYGGFAAPTAWGGIEQDKDFTDSQRVGGGAHGFVGLGPPGCQPHFGFQLGGSGTDTTQRVSFLDVNGDGLPDRLDEDGDVDLNRYEPAGDPDGGTFAAGERFDNTGELGHTKEWSLDLGVGGHLDAPVKVNLDANWVWSHSNDDHLIADMNGDLRPDLVTTDGGFKVRVNDGRDFIVSDAPWGGFGANGLSLSSPDEEAEVMSSFRLSHALRQLLLPYAGRVALSGAIVKKESKGDGVDAAIYHNGALLWRRSFAADDVTACEPGPGNSCNGGLTRDVLPGDSFYFLAGSVRDTDFDALLWAPVVSYEGRDPETREPSGARTFVFDGGDDFALAGYRGASWKALANGTVQISGSVVKEQTASDVLVSIARKRGDHGEEVLFSRTFAAAEQAGVDGFPAITVAENDLLFLRVESPAPLDPSRVRWTPTVSYEGPTTVTNADGRITTVTLDDRVRVQAAQVAIAVPLLLPFQEPMQSWSAPATGEQTFFVSCMLNDAAAAFYVQGVNRLVHARPLAAPSGIVPLTAFELRLPVTAGEPLFFTLLADARFSPELPGIPASLIPPGACDVSIRIEDTPVPVPVNVRSRLADAFSSLSGGHHGWYYGDWNGNIAFHPNGLIPPDDEGDKPDYVPGVPRWDGLENFDGPVWTAGGFDVYLAAEGVKPSRKGANAAGVLDEASGTGAAGGLSVLRKTSGKTEGLGAGLAPFGLSLSSGTSTTQLDLMDMNGDRYPDQVSGSGVRFSNGRTGFGDLKGFPGLRSSVRESQDHNVSNTLGIGITFTRKNGKGKSTAVLNTMPSVGASVSLSHMRDDLNDVNGDGLPDRVSMEPGSGTVKVQLNLGYRFGAEESWELPNLPDSGRCGDFADKLGSTIATTISNLDTVNGLSFTRSTSLQAGVAIGPFGGGVSTTLARTLADLIDVNGDGLPDRVAKEQGDDFFRVQLNLGYGWAGEQHWSVPRWPTSIGGVYNLGGVFQCLDAVNFSGHMEANGSAGAPICIPLVPPVPVVGLQIEISAQGYGSISSGMQLFLEDIDGDGLADHILKKGGDDRVYVKRNQAGKVNLLSTVHRPLGSTISISYDRRGNHVDMPFNQWVLSAVSVADGREESAPSVTRYDYANDAFYDRQARENYGYGHLRITLPDESTIDQTFLNRSIYSRHLKSEVSLADRNRKVFRVETSTYAERTVQENRDPLRVSRTPELHAELTSFSEPYAPGGDVPKQTRRTYRYDAYGNVTDTVDSGDSLSTPDDDLIAAVTYQLNPTRPVSIKVTDGTNRLLRQRLGSFTPAGDLQTLEQVLVGGNDPATGSRYTGSKNAVRTYTYDAFGNIATSVDPTGFKATVTYDSETRTHPVEVTDSFGYRSRFLYDLDHGALTATIDQNDNVMVRSYDDFGRLVSVAGPYDSDAAPALTFEYNPRVPLGSPSAQPPISWAVAHHKDATRPDPIDSAVFVDGLERVIQTKDEAELDLGSGTSTQAGMRVSGRITFDTKGRVVSEGQPVFDRQAAKDFVKVPVKHPTTFTHDALDRVRTVTFPHGGTTRVDYVFGTLAGARKLLTVRTDSKLRVTKFYRDVADNVVGVEQTNTIAGASKTLLTRYTYDALDQLTKVEDAKGNATTLEYDTLGRNVLLTSPDLGRTELRFDPAGNLQAKITANLAARREQVRRFYTFNRLDRIDYPQSPDVVYTYGAPGAAQNRANRIVTITDGSGVEERSYGKLGETVQTVKTTAALNGTTPKGPYTTKFAFDSFERLLSVVYPDGETLTYGYDAGGQVKSAAGVLKGVRVDYLRHLGYDELGEQARMVAGNGVETRYTYHPASRFLTRLRTTAAGRDLQNLRYEYDLTGTIQSIDNEVPVPAAPLFGGPTSQTFQYDNLVQLVGAKGTYRTAPNKTSTYALNLSYDALGNTVAKNQLHQTGTGGKLNVEKKTSYNWAYAYAGPQPHAPTRVGERTFHYDANGNQLGWTSDTNGTRRTLTWDEENRLSSVADNGQTTRFLYDAEGTRTNKAGQHGETTYVNRWFTVRNGAIASKHVFADQTRLATKVSPTPDPPAEKVYYFAPDHLGSSHFVTDALGAVYQHLEYFPSGETWVDERSETQRTPYLFSGKELDEETGLSYFGYRYYDARQGQWISADPILDEMLDTSKLSAPSLSPGSFHLPGQPYAYVANDPLNRVDPRGLNHEDMLTAMAKIKGMNTLKAAYVAAKDQHKAGYEYQIETTYALFQQDQVAEVEYTYNEQNNRADILLTDGTLVEVKNTVHWEKAWKQLNTELAAYAQSGSKLLILSKHDLPGEIQAMVSHYAPAKGWQLEAGKAKRTDIARNAMPLALRNDTNPLKWLADSNIKIAQEMGGWDDD